MSFNVTLLLFFLIISLSQIIGQTNFILLHPPHNYGGKTAFAGPPYWTYASANQYYRITDSAFDNWIGTIDNAFQVWNNVSVVQFSRSTSEGLPLFSYYDDSEKIGSIINPGKARVDGNNYKINTTLCNIRINRRHQWTNGTNDAQNNIIDLKSILVHEIGHILGIDQATEMGPTAPTMSGWNNPSFWIGTEMATLEQYDINAANFLQTLVPTLYQDLQAAVNVAQQIGVGWVVVESQYNLSSNILIPAGVNLIINPGVTINMGSYFLIASGGTIQNNGSISGLAANLKSGSTIVGYFPSIQVAINNASSSNTVELLATTYSLSPSISSKTNITLSGQGSSSTIINGSISVTNSTIFK